MEADLSNRGIIERLLRTEVSYTDKRVVDYGTKGIVHFDVVLYGGADGKQPIIAWDFKTGSARLTPARIRHLQKVSGFDIPVVELRGR